MVDKDIREQRIETLKSTQEKRKEESRNRVHEAIEKLLKMNAKINFHTVAREAQVSVSYLYKYPELKQRVAELRSQQSSMPVKPLNKPNSTAQGKVITRLQERLKRVEDENKELKKKNEALAGQVYRVYQLQEQVERLQKENERLRGKLKEQEIEEKVVPISRTPKASPSPSKPPESLSASIEDELKDLGINLNNTLRKTIKQAEEQQVLDAIESLKDQLEQGKVSNPEGWLNKAIKEGWTKPEPVAVVTSPSKPEHQVVTQPKDKDSDKKLVSNEKLKALTSKLFNN